MNAPGGTRGNITRPNRLLQGLVGFSLVIHFFLFLYMARIYKKADLSYIEFILQDVSPPPARQIPRPRSRPKSIAATPVSWYPNEIALKRRSIPQPSSNKVEQLKHLSLPAHGGEISALRYGVSERAYLTEDISGIPITEWKPGDISREGGSDFQDQTSYFDVVRLMIERHKKYPLLARRRQIEGEVTIHFVLTQEGNIIKIEVVKPSPYAIFNQAAVKAVQEAAPFPKPPSHLFMKDVSLELTIKFEMV